ncbi:MAG: peptidylprolyl isomerase, partial [Bacteroidaceae bacterium]|nr:peptidylprolyl isomerase [Bacteroidaceae bacterium]
QWYIVTGKKYKPEQLREYEVNMDLDKKMKLIEKGKKERMKEIFQLRKEGKKEEVQNIYEQIEDNAQMEVAKHPFIRFPQSIIDTYVNVGGCPFLDSQYTVFGEVLEGMDVVDAIQYVKTDQAKRPLEDIKIIKVTVNKPSNK